MSGNTPQPDQRRQAVSIPNRLMACVVAIALLSALAVQALQRDTDVATAAGEMSMVSAGFTHSCGIVDGGAWCWGGNESGQLGNGSFVDSAVPVPVSGLTAGVTAISAGSNHTCAVLASGGAKCWGNNDHGQLGNGTTTTANTPQDVSGLASGVVAVSAADIHTCARTVSGARCWGGNEFGQLGDGSLTARHVPGPVSGLSGVVDVSAGTYHSCAVTTGALVKCWGFNYFSQLGTGSPTLTGCFCIPTPVTATVLTANAANVSAGGFHTCALTAAGGVQCWGNNGNGQLGIAATSGFANILAGELHSCALTTDEGIVCSGENGSGQLGDGTWEDRDTPVNPIGLAAGAGAVSAGTFHTCALTTGGNAKCWGEGHRGQLGNGTTADSSVPVDVLIVKPTPTPTITSTPTPTATTTPTLTPTPTPCPPGACPTPLMNTPTSTAGPSPTPKPPSTGGQLTGVHDIVMDNGDPSTDLFHCISYLQDRGDGTVKVAAICYDNTGKFGDWNGEPLNDPVSEGPGGDGGAVGPPPPPPYTLAAPAKGVGSIDGSGTLTAAICFPELGLPFGPNIIWDLTIPNAQGQLTATGKQVGTISWYLRQSDTACEAAANNGTLPPTAPQGIGTTSYPSFDSAICPAGDCVQSPFRVDPIADFDGDACSDQAELDKLDTSECGDDPWNPNDTTLSSIDVEGDYNMLMTPVDVDCDPTASGDPSACEHPNDSIPGFYFHCPLAIEQDGKNVKAWVSCYVDFPGWTVNPQAAGATTCPPASTGRCGDGFPGSPPPGVTVPTGVTFPTVAQRLFADVNKVQDTFTGFVDNTHNQLSFEGCFQDVDHFFPWGNVYAGISVDLHTGHGWMEIHISETDANCLNGTPANPSAFVPVDLVRQHKGSLPMRDADGDGCGDRRELGDPGDLSSANLTEFRGGRRDPLNHYDYMNPTHDGLNRVDDIVATLNQYFDDDNDSTPGYPPFTPGYNQDTDRTALAGANEWNLGPPNGLQRVDDIVAALKSYFHDCNTTSY